MLYILANFFQGRGGGGGWGWGDDPPLWIDKEGHLRTECLFWSCYVKMNVKDETRHDIHKSTMADSGRHITTLVFDIVHVHFLRNVHVHFTTSLFLTLYMYNS